MEKNDHMGYQSQSMPGDEALGVTLHGWSGTDCAAATPLPCQTLVLGLGQEAIGQGGESEKEECRQFDLERKEKRTGIIQTREGKESIWGQTPQHWEVLFFSSKRNWAQTAGGLTGTENKWWTFWMTIWLTDHVEWMIDRGIVIPNDGASPFSPIVSSRVSHLGGKKSKPLDFLIKKNLGTLDSSKVHSSLEILD